MAENRTGYFSSPFKTASEFTLENAVLPIGVTGTESDTQKMKCGDGVTAWNDLEYNKVESTASNTFEFRPLTIGYAGDSIALQWSRNGGLSPVFWFASHKYPADVKNIFVTAVGGTPSSSLLEDMDLYGEFVPSQIDTLEALSVKPELMIVHSTQNDWIGSTALADESYSNVTTYIDRALAAGVKYVIFAGKPPRDGQDDPKSIEYLNRKFYGYAQSNSKVYFLDVVGLWRLKPVASDVDGVSIEWESKYSNDGTHPSSEAMYDLADELIPILSPLVQQKRLQPTSAYEYDNDTAQYANLVGLDGMVLGTGGQYNGVDDARVAGVDERPWKVTDGNGIIATPSIVVGDDGYNYQQIEFSGTATGDITIQIKNETGTGVVDQGTFVQEFVMYLNNVENVDSIRYDSAPITGSAISEYGQPFVGENRIHLTAEGEIDIEEYSTINLNFSFSINSGDSPTGIVRIGRVGIYRQA